MKNNICSMCGGVADSSKSYRCRKCDNEYMAKYRETHRDRVREIQRRSRHNIYNESAYQRQKDAARRKVRYALDSGRMARLPCERCGEPAEAHHDSYRETDWLKVRWLCVEHHSEFHRLNKHL